MVVQKRKGCGRHGRNHDVDGRGEGAWGVAISFLSQCLSCQLKFCSVAHQSFQLYIRTEKAVMASRLQNFVNRNSLPDRAGVQDQHDAPYPSRPATAQNTRTVSDDDRRPRIDDTDAEGLDESHLSSDGQHQTESDLGSDDDEFGHADAQQYDPNQSYGHDSLQDLDTNDGQHGALRPRFHNEQLEKLNAMMHEELHSYPPTTSGDPESFDGCEAEDGVDVQMVQGQTHHTSRIKVPQQHKNSTFVADPHSHRGPAARSTGPEEFKMSLANIKRGKLLARNPQTTEKLPLFNGGVPQAAVERVQTMKHQVASHHKTSRPTDRIQPSFEEAEYSPHIAAQLRTTGTVDQQQGNGQSSEKDHDHDAQPLDLDYNIEELYKKDFDALQKDPFDGPARGNNGSVPSNPADQSLEKRLATFAKLDPSQQSEFFSSLSLEEWEEAGDWFQERFSDVFKKLKEARKARRNLAAKFEKEISDRQQAVTRKRNITEDALSGIKRSGSLVLESTPKKRQKFRDAGV